MSFDELYPIVKTQAYFAVLRYEEPDRRKDKIQELVCQSFEKYQRDLAAGRPIKKQDYKCFVTQRAKQVDCRSIVKGGGGGTSTMDPLGFYRRRPDSPTQVVEFDEWMSVRADSKEKIEANLSFGIDYSDWLKTLNSLQRKVLAYLIEGYKCSKIAEMLKSSAAKIKQIILELRKAFVHYFHISALQLEN